MTVTVLQIPLSPAMSEAADEIARGLRPAAPIAPAATVVLLRDAGDGAGVEAYVQQRNRGLAFAGGVYAFPGGRVDPADTDVPDDLWWGPRAPAWVERFQAADEQQARGHVVAVVRELFEETGVLLARRRAAGAAWPGEEQRRAVAAGQTCLADVLGQADLLLDAEALTGWARWVTPRFERRRFDAWFFLARLPDGQEPRVATEESHEGRWVRPGEAAGAAEAGRLAMLPPTWWTLRQVAQATSVDEVLADPPPMVRYTVGWVRRGGQTLLVLPDDPDYPGMDPQEGL